MEIRTLKNGMKIIYYSMPCAGVSTFAVNVRVGSDYERGNYGISHFVEHLLFDGTVKMSEYDIVNKLESIGGHVNASTSEINTFFHATVPSGYEEKAVDVISDIILNPKLGSEHVQREKNIVLSEMAMEESNAVSRLATLVYEAMTGRPSAIGTKSSIQSMTRMDAINFHQQWYVPNNITAIIAGAKPALEAIAGKFEAMTPARVPKRPGIPVSIPIKNSITDHKIVQNPFVTISYPTDGFSAKDDYAVDVIASILGRPMSGRLFVKTRMKRGLVYHIGCAHSAMPSYGVFQVLFSARRSKIEECRQIVLDEINKVDDVNIEEMNSSKNYIKGMLARSKDNTSSITALIAYFDSIGDPTLVDKYIGWINGVKQSDISSAKKKYFSGKHLEVAIR